MKEYIDLIKLIALDLDGTLLDHRRKLPKKNYQAIQEAKEKGIDIIISTGSPYTLIPHGYLKGLDISHAITTNGSAIYEYKTGRCIYENSIATSKVLPILEFLLTKDMHIDIFIQGEAYCPEYTRAIVEKLEVPASRKEYILNNRVWLENPISYIREHEFSVQKITMNFYPDKTGILVDREEVKKYLENNIGVNLVSGGWGNLEITKKDANKGEALKQVCKIKNIQIENTMAIGDSSNDLDIIKIAGIGVAMGNAMTEVIEAADYVTGTNDECGVAEVINKL